MQGGFQIIAEKSQRLRDQLLSLQKNLSGIEGTNGVLDFGNFKWAWPLTTAPLAAVISESGREVVNCSSYLETVGFPKGKESVEDLRRPTYIPLVRISNSPIGLNEKLESRFSELVLNNIDFAGNFRNAWSYTLGEMVANLTEHSKSTYGWLFAQYWPKLEYLDFVIVDRGHGFRRVYEEAHRKVYTDQEALRLALLGHSVKKDKERGYGIRTTKKLITGAEIKGNFFIISGGFGYYSDSNRDLWIDLSPWQWKGAIILCRARRVQKPVDIYKYVEG